MKIILVVGAGLPGLVCAYQLVQAGHSVLLIERGGELDKGSIQTTRYDYELDSPWNKHSSEWRGNIKPQRHIGVGGSSVLFQGVSHLPSESVIRSWGIDIARFRKAEQFVRGKLNIAGDTLPFHPLNSVSRHLYNSAEKLGWAVQPAPVAILSSPKDGRPSCNHCGLCIYGCLPGDKSSADNVWYPELKAHPNVKILTNTKVEGINLTAEDSVESVSVLRNGVREKIIAGSVVLCAGVLETPKILKNSRQKLAPDGIGSANVGKYLTGSLWASLLVAGPESSKDGYMGVPTDIMIREFDKQGIQLYQSRNMAGITGPMSAVGVHNDIIRSPDPRQWMQGYYPRLAGLTGFAESSTSEVDQLIFSPEPEIQKLYTDADGEKTNQIKSLLQDWANAAGAEILNEMSSHQSNVTGAMLRGTCRMGLEPNTSVVSPEGNIWGIKNLYIADASVIGRGMIADPSLFLQAYGAYVADNIVGSAGANP
ncbi:MAG: GMC family oxidoreductase N-terminal domain-containing protein [Saccharospirillaceae bacterium]|nr:GMC family oxidoreductase N-terminal domain-containing protein [Saccharospirillaceae bacterium]